MLKLKTALFRNRSIGYSSWGKGECKVVLLHGFMGNKTLWAPFFDRLDPDEFTVFSIDLPGHGDSDCLATVHSMELMADVVRQVLHIENIEKAHLTGHSMGGYVALAYAEKYSDLVCSLCLFNSTSKEDSPAKKRDRYRAIRVFELNPKIFINEAINNLFTELYRKKHPEEVQRTKNIALNTSLGGVSAALRGMAERKNREHVMASEAFSTLYLAGKFDRVVSLEQVQHQVDRTGAQLVEMTRTSHMGFLEEFELAFNSLLKLWTTNQ